MSWAPSAATFGRGFVLWGFLGPVSEDDQMDDLRDLNHSMIAPKIGLGNGVHNAF